MGYVVAINKAFPTGYAMNDKTFQGNGYEAETGDEIFKAGAYRNGDPLVEVKFNHWGDNTIIVPKKRHNIHDPYEKQEITFEDQFLDKVIAQLIQLAKTKDQFADKIARLSEAGKY